MDMSFVLRRRDVGLTTALIALSLIATLSGCRPAARNGASQAPVAVSSALELYEPSLQPGQVADLAAPEIQRWRFSQPLAHALSGRVKLSGSRLQVRPWIYADAWIPQPVAKVRPDGRFTATLLFDARYDSPLVLTLEVEDHDTGRIVATSDYFLRQQAPGGAS